MNYFNQLNIFNNYESNLKKMFKHIFRIALFSLISFVFSLFFDRVLLNTINIIIKCINKNVVSKLPVEKANIVSAFSIFRYFTLIDNFSWNRIYFWWIIFFFFLLLFYIEKKYIIKYRYIFVSLLIMLLTLGKFTGSSLGFYDGMLIENTDEYVQSTLLGNNQGLRGDEWATEKPYYFAQGSNDYKYYNYNLMFDGCDMVVSAFAPVKNILILARPDLIGFLIFQYDYAFAFYWNFRLIMLFMASFEFGYLLSKNYKMGIVWGFFVVFSSPVQWWLSQINTIIITSGEFFIVLYANFLKKSSVLKKIILSLLMAWMGIIYILTMYPATQVPFAYIFLGVLVYIIWENKRYKPFDLINNLCYLIILTTISLFMLYFIHMSGNAMKLILNTSYPGNSRNWVKLDWDYELLQLINPIMWCKYITTINNCEASQFYTFLPFVIIVFFLRKKHNNKRLLPLCIFFPTSVLWIVLHMREHPIINKITLLSFSYPSRLMMVAGFGWMLLIFVLINEIRDDEIKKEYNITISILIGIITLCFCVNSYHLKIYSGELNIISIFIILIVAFFCYMGYCLLRGGKKYTKVFVILYCCLCFFTTIFINPLTYGTDSMFQKKIMKTVREINENEPGRWMVSGNATISNLVTAQGVARVSGTYYYPDFSMMEIIDPNRSQIDMWNQYAHIDMRLREGDNELSQFDYEYNEMRGGTDRIIYVNLNTAKQLHIKYVLVSYRTDNYQEYINNGDINLLYRSDVDGWSIYQIIY